MKHRFTDQAVWITGGGSGLGEAMAAEFATRGARVALSGRRVDRLNEVAEGIGATGGTAMVVPCDVTSDDAVRDAVGAVVETFGRIDVAIANAGMGVVGRFERLSDAEWKQQFGVNLFGLVSTARHALPELRKSHGRLVLMGSVTGLVAGERTSAYCASKFAVRAIGLSLAQELHGSGVSCTTLCPGFVESDINRVDNQGHYDASRPDLRPQRLMWPSDRAAKVMLDAIAARKREYVFTGHGRIGAFMGKHFPGLIHIAATRVGGRRK
ncbi:MAG: short-chain dehydrogenase [Gemmatimonadetes bacterium]|nr:short-chain dehydrogenase [Gemmatimonadota bacterium]